MIDKKQILIVEDDFDLLWMIKKILTMNDFTVLTAVTGKNAMDKFSRNFFQIRAVVLDLSLPDKDGNFVCKEFRKVSQDLPIIIMTGYEESECEQELQRLRVQGYLKKPFDIMKLVDLLNAII